MITVSVLTKASKEVLQDLNRLMAQLRPGQPVRRGSLSELAEIIGNKHTAVVVAKEGSRIIGAATLFIIQKVGRRTGHVEDVVVDQGYRGQGVGEKVMRKLIAVARAKKLHSIALTSRPERVAGNKLYQKLGFARKETNVYRLKL